ncbi:hypothetical protein [Adhaeretor mobilis]|nr:hypothetical protein [Adhaeretor mobilis]
MVIALFSSRPLQAAEDKFWALSAYKIHVTLSVDASARPETNLTREVQSTIERRVQATLTPLWKLTIEPASLSQRELFKRQLPNFTWEDLSDELKAFDKLQTLSIVATNDGYLLRCREYDVYARRWGMPVERRVYQRSMLAEEAFQLLTEAFSPLATIEPVDDDDTRVELVFRGSRLPRRSGDINAVPLIAKDQVFLPVLRRTNRAGELLANGIVPIPWTYLVTDAPEGESCSATVFTGARRPFGSRRRGSVQKLAIGLRQPDASTDVRFYARHSKEQPLPGYEVFLRDAVKETSHPLGVTDAHGTVTVPPGEKPVSMLFLRSDGQLLAKIPVAPGVTPLLEAPIADDPVRLRATAEITEIREQLIDLVARRAIYMARIRARIKEDRIKDAEDIMAQLNDLPSRAFFDRAIKAAQRGSSSEDAQIQQRIDKLFSDTQTLLVKFLDSRPLTELQSELTAAKRG